MRKNQSRKVAFGKVVRLVVPNKYEIPVEEIRTTNRKATKTTHCLDCQLICENH